MNKIEITIANIPFLFQGNSENTFITAAYKLLKECNLENWI